MVLCTGGGDNALLSVSLASSPSSSPCPPSILVLLPRPPIVTLPPPYLLAPRESTEGSRHALAAIPSPSPKEERICAIPLLIVLAAAAAAVDEDGADVRRLNLLTGSGECMNTSGPFIVGKKDWVLRGKRLYSEAKLRSQLLL